MSSNLGISAGIPLRRLVAVLALPLLAWLGGCTDGPRDLVHGKVTLDGQSVAGEIVFVGAGDKKFKAPILDGKYSLAGAPAGTYKVAIEAGPGAPGGVKDGPAPPGKDLKTGDKMTGMPEAKGGGGVAPPAKYNSVETSGLTLEVKGGKQEKDWALSK